MGLGDACGLGNLASTFDMEAVGGIYTEVCYSFVYTYVYAYLRIPICMQHMCIPICV